MGERMFDATDEELAEAEARMKAAFQSAKPGDLCPDCGAPPGYTASTCDGHCDWAMGAREDTAP